MAGAALKEIQEAAGDKTTAITARYAHLSPEHTQSVVERIARKHVKQASAGARVKKSAQRAPKQAPAN
jgi:hypothetical protein